MEYFFMILLHMKKAACISTSGSMVCHLFICCTVFEQNPHIIAAGIDDTVNKNFAAVSTVEADVIATYNKAIITLYIRNRRQRSPGLCMVL